MIEDCKLLDEIMDFIAKDKAWPSYTLVENLLDQPEFSKLDEAILSYHVHLAYVRGWLEVEYPPAVKTICGISYQYIKPTIIGLTSEGSTYCMRKYIAQALYAKENKNES